MAQFQAKDYSIAYNIVESAWTHDLIFLNGNLATSRWWMPAVEELKVLTHKKETELTGRMIFIELPGCGESSKLTTDLEVHTIVQNYLDLLKEINVKKASIIGHSTGGLLANLMMAKAPELFNKGLLLDPVGAQGIQFEQSTLDKYEEMVTNPELTAIIIAFTIQNCDTSSEFFRQIIAKDTQKSIENVGSRMILALRNKTFIDEMKQIKTPVTILFGEKDFLLPKEHALQLTELIPQTKFIEVEEAGHCLNVENPKKMAHFIFSELV